MFQHLLLPIDDDEGSRFAIRQGVSLARRLGARITGFHAMAEFAHPGIVDELLDPPPDELRTLALAHAEKLLAPLRSEAERAGVACATAAERGDRPYEAIVAAAKQHGCDLIVMASHGRRGLAKLILGSQTQQVLNRAEIPVLVLR